MNKIHFVLLLACFSLFSIANTFAIGTNRQSVRTNQVDFNKTFIGKINNKINVVFKLKNAAGKLSGFYYYEKIGVEINVVGTVENNSFILYELDYLNQKTAKITGKLVANTFKGTWENISTKSSLPILLTASNKNIPMLPANFLGVYRFSKETGCNLALTITKEKGNYRYQLKTSKRVLKGKVTLSRELDEQMIYIGLNGIQWEEYDGDVSNRSDDNESSESTLSLPTVIDGLLGPGEIIIQNYGNAMNSYTKLGECSDEKYIKLRK